MCYVLHAVATVIKLIKLQVSKWDCYDSMALTIKQVQCFDFFFILNKQIIEH